MYMRLAFSVAAHLEPEILIVDEVLALADIQFKKKCLGKMSEVANAGRRVLFVSHNISAVRKLCTHTLLLEQGSVAMIGTTNIVTNYYIEGVQKVQATYAIAPPREPDAVGFATSLTIEDTNGTLAKAILVGQPWQIR